LIETNFVTLSPDAKLIDIVQAVKVSSRSFYPVVDEDQAFKGVVVLDDVRSILFDSEKYDSVYIKDYMRYSDEFIVEIDEPMEKIVEKFKISDRYTLVVVENGKYLGFISRANIFSAYQKYIREWSNE
jgi:CIC family chloride channel protein